MKKFTFWATLVITVVAVLVSPFIQSKKIHDNFPIADVTEMQEGTDRIHFMNTAASDAILIESDGHFALIDCAEDSDNPRGFDNLEYTGYEEVVLKYLKDHAMNEDGKVHLDFVLGTHSHSDHLGGFDTIIEDPDVEIDRAYLKVYNSSVIRDKEINEWDNQEVYDQMVNALNAKNVPIISDISEEPFQFGNFTLRFFNTVDPDPGDKKVGENDQSVVTLVEKNGMRAVLSGDLDNLTGDEARLAPEIGKVDLLKVGHHGINNSTTPVWLKGLMPEVCVVTNKATGVNPITTYNITRITKAPMLMTGVENGVIAQFTDSEILYFNNIH